MILVSVYNATSTSKQCSDIVIAIYVVTEHSLNKLLIDYDCASFAQFLIASLLATSLPVHSSKLNKIPYMCVLMSTCKIV